MHQALYRKYRPRTFDDVCGEDHITSVLKYEARESRFSHAYLFCGPRGTGKTTCAKILAKAVNCLSPVDGNPCGKCFACESIDNGHATDVLEMDAASNNGVDYIRDIRDEVNYVPSSLKKRVYIIDEVHMLSTSAFNALLKTLEEPPEHVVFILATTEFHKLPATIVSRCQRFDFRRIKADVIAARLMHIAEKEGLTLHEDAAKIIAKQSQGGMRDAISLFELCSAGGHDVTAEHVSDVLGLTGIEILYKSAVAVARNDASSIFKIIKTVDSSSKDVSVYWSELIGFWRDMLVFKYLPEGERTNYLDLTEPEMRLLADGARRFTPEALTYHFELLDEALREMTRLPQTKRLIAELTLIKMSDASLETSTSALLSRISALEEKVSLLESTPTAVKRSTEDTVSTKEIKSEPDRKEAPAEVAKTEKVAEELPEQPAPARSMHSIDLSDVAERISEKNPSVSGFLIECDCQSDEEGEYVLITTANAFAKMMLTTEAAMQSMQSAFRMCGITKPGAVIEVVVGAVTKKKPAIDELEEF